MQGEWWFGWGDKAHFFTGAELYRKDLFKESPNMSVSVCGAQRGRREKAPAHLAAKRRCIDCLKRVANGADGPLTVQQIDAINEMVYANHADKTLKALAEMPSMLPVKTGVDVQAGAAMWVKGEQVDLNAPQPPTKPSNAPAVWDLVIHDMRQRDEHGAKKYGVRLTPGDGRGLAGRRLPGVPRPGGVPAQGDLRKGQALMPLTRKELDKKACDVPGCKEDHEGTEFYVHGRCHPHAALQAMYSKKTGLLTISCASCEAPIVEFKVANG